MRCSKSEKGNWNLTRTTYIHGLELRIRECVHDQLIKIQRNQRSSIKIEAYQNLAVGVFYQNNALTIQVHCKATFNYLSTGWKYRTFLGAKYYWKIMYCNNHFTHSTSQPTLHTRMGSILCQLLQLFSTLKQQAVTNNNVHFYCILRPA